MPHQQQRRDGCPLVWFNEEYEKCLVPADSFTRERWRRSGIEASEYLDGAKLHLLISRLRSQTKELDCQCYDTDEAAFKEQLVKVARGAKPKTKREP